MANQPPTFRFPFALQDQPKTVQQAHIYTFNAIQDIQQALQALKSQISALQTTIAKTTTTTVTTAAGTVTIPTIPTLGTVNDQLGNVLYLTQQSDNGALIVLGDSSPIALQLNSTVTQPYFGWVTNLDSAAATLTPTTGNINLLPYFTIPGGESAEYFISGSDWWATVFQAGGGGGVTQLLAGTNITLTPPGGTGVVTVNSSGGGGLGTFSDEVVTMAGTAGTLAHTPATFIGLFKNGMKLTALGGSPDFTRVGTAITLTVAAVGGDFYEAIYWY